MIVVDASALAPALCDDGEDGALARTRLSTEVLTAPQLLDLEVTSVVRGLLRSGQITAERAAAALADLRELPVERAGHRDLLGRCWELRENLTPYDAAYVALAELLGLVLVTADRSLSRAPGVRCGVEVLGD